MDLPDLSAIEANSLELVKLDVHWEISAQLLDKTRDSPIGTDVTNITIS